MKRFWCVLKQSPCASDTLAPQLSLSRKQVAIDCLKAHLSKELVELINLESLQLTKGSFVDDGVPRV